MIDLVEHASVGLYGLRCFFVFVEEWATVGLYRLRTGCPHKVLTFLQVFLSKPHDSQKDFELNRKINNFVSKYYKA